MQRYVILFSILIGLIWFLRLIRKQKNMKEQPAQESYFFSKSFSDLTKIRKRTKELNQKSKENRTIVPRIIIVVVGGMLTIVTSTVHNILFLVLCMLVYIVFAIVYVIDGIYNFVNGLGTACPHSGCQEKFKIAIYKCDKCGAMHDKLVPGKYGIIKRTCKCGKKLPTSFMNGRGKLQAYCPRCKRPIKGETNTKQYAIPIVGGPSVGKTCYINTVSYNLISKVAKEQDWTVSFLDKDNEEEYKLAIDNMKKGRKPPKTDSDKLTAYQLAIKVKKETIPRRLYIYDIMGEVFKQENVVRNNQAFSYADGIIFMIDPLSITDFAMEIIDSSIMSENGASQEDFNDIFENLLNSLTALYDPNNVGLIMMNVAVVINKCDLRKLDSYIGATAVEKYMNSHSECKNPMKASNILCRQFLEKYNCGAFVQLIEKKFMKVQYFACSTLAHNSDGSIGIGAENPVLWLLSQKDKSIKM